MRASGVRRPAVARQVHGNKASPRPSRGSTVRAKSPAATAKQSPDGAANRHSRSTDQTRTQSLELGLNRAPGAMGREGGVPGEAGWGNIGLLVPTGP